MTRLVIELPDEVAQALSEQAKAAGHSTPESFLAAWARAEWGLTCVNNRAELEQKLLEALDSGPSQPVDRDDWEAIRREGKARLASLRGGGQ